ncbi:PREDICTED: keratinocyte proline-rich protein-like, partial [Lipotes vexillifer]|uniref:Keratinocyte proline-rich protein-like n=1 Tax=Lipotes vexillifer TaxID=118797 RepID=A0A340X3U1_LIPVE
DTGDRLPNSPTGKAVSLSALLTEFRFSDRGTNGLKEAPRTERLRAARAAQRPTQPRPCPRARPRPQLQPGAEGRSCSPPGSYGAPTPPLCRDPGALAPPARQAGEPCTARRSRSAPQDPGAGPAVPRRPPPPARCARPAHQLRRARRACPRVRPVPVPGTPSRLAAHWRLAGVGAAPPRPEPPGTPGKGAGPRQVGPARLEQPGPRALRGFSTGWK